MRQLLHALALPFEPSLDLAGSVAGAMKTLSPLSSCFAPASWLRLRPPPLREQLPLPLRLLRHPSGRPCSRLWTATAANSSANCTRSQSEMAWAAAVAKRAWMRSAALPRGLGAVPRGPPRHPMDYFEKDTPRLAA